MKRSEKQLIKLMILGEVNTGKTNLLLRYCDAQFTMTHLTTLGVDIKLKHTEIDGRKVKLQFWDTAGQERFYTITKNYFRAAEGIILTFAINDRDSFENVTNWIQQIQENAAGKQIARILVGNKCDLESERDVQTSQAEQFAQKHGLQYFEVSAKQNVRVESSFEHLVRMVLKIQSEEQKQKQKGKQLSNQSKKKDKSDCC